METEDPKGFWHWFERLPDWGKVLVFLSMTISAAFALGLAAAAAFSQQLSLPEEIRRARAETAAVLVIATNNRERIAALEEVTDEFRRFAGCVLSETVEERDIGPCRYILRDPTSIRPPTPK